MKKLNNILEGMFDVESAASNAQQDFLMTDLNWIKDSALKNVIGEIRPTRQISLNMATILTKAGRTLKGSDLAEAYEICQRIQNSSLSEEFKNNMRSAVVYEFKNLYIRVGCIRALEALYTPITEIDKILKNHKHLKILKKAWIDFPNNYDYSNVELTISVQEDQKEEWRNLFDEAGSGFKSCDEGFSVICELKDPLIQTIHKIYKNMFI